jgi:hypothetical protein
MSVIFISINKIPALYMIDYFSKFIEILAN